MKPATFVLLKDLQGSRFSDDFGKICQCLLALAFHEAGFKHVVNRLVEGTDIDASGDLGRFAIEVKTTTEGHEVVIGEKDLKGWKDRARDHYSAVLAALRVSLLSGWTLSHAGELGKGEHRIQALRLNEIGELTKTIQGGFDRLVQKHVPDLLKLSTETPLNHLNKLLRKAGIEAQD